MFRLALVVPNLPVNNPAGDLISLTDGKLQTTRWNYDLYGRVTNKVDQAGAEILRYLYDADNRLTNRWSAQKGNTKYKYDNVGNLTNVDYATSTDVVFKYDELNRRTNMVDGIGTTKFTYTPGNQLLTEDGPFPSDILTNTIPLVCGRVWICNSQRECGRMYLVMTPPSG